LINHTQDIEKPLKREAEYYDNYYNKRAIFTGHYAQSPCYHIFLFILEFLLEIKKPKILDIGCGTGQLSYMLWEQGYENYTGFDFSSYAIKTAKERDIPSHKFEVGDARNPEIYKGDYNTVISTEVMEHLDDITVMYNIPKGANFLFSVPKKGCESHIRVFRDFKDVEERYGKFLEFTDMVWVEDRYWVVSSKKK